jgi:hypothetical protein
MKLQTRQEIVDGKVGVVSLELAKKMKELGFAQQSLFWWQYTDFPLKNGTRWELKYKNQIRESDLELSHPDDIFSTYTVGELGDMLPKKCPEHDGNLQIIPSFNGGWLVGYGDHMNFNGCHVEDDKTEADARAKMLIYLVEKGLLDTKTLG